MATLPSDAEQKKKKKTMATSSTNSKQLHPGQWNVQVVRGKVTTKCLWNACKALSIGLFLMTVGAAMAIVGYYADHLSVRNEIRGNSTVRVKNENRVFHLNNLSYAGPVIMGIGGFIVVAACVMTFEARDSAAKVVPARFKPSTNSSAQLSTAKSTPNTLRSLKRLDSKINSSCQTPLSKASYKLSNIGSGDGSPINDPFGRKMLTSAFVQFSRALMEDSPLEASRRSWRRTSEANLNKSPSAPNLCVEEVPVQKSHDQEPRKITTPKIEAKPQRGPTRTVDRCALLSTQLLQKQALSVDSPFYDAYGRCTPPPGLCRQCSEKSENSRDSLHMELGASAGVSGSQVSMALDLHDCQVTLQVKDESQNRRSDTSRRHQLLRQRPVEDEKESPRRCLCTTQMIYTNTSDDSVIQRPKTKKSSDFSRSRSCTEPDKRIYFIEDQKNWKFPSAEKLRSPPKDVSYHIHRRVDTSGCSLHRGELVRKNAKRRKSSQAIETSLSSEERGANFPKCPTLRSPSSAEDSSFALNKPEGGGCCSRAAVSPEVS